MNQPTDEQILAFLAGEADPDVRDAVLAEAERSPDFAERLRSAATGWTHVDEWRSAQATAGAVRSRASLTVPAWWVPVAAAAALVVALPLGRMATPDSGTDRIVGVPEDVAPSFVVVLQGTWPDAGMVGPDEASRRAAEYWGWAESLAAEERLVAAGDLAWESGLRLTTSDGAPVVGPDGSESLDPARGPELLVGMFTIRATDYEEALRIARNCPHLRYGGTISVRRVSMGFVTVPGMDDWSS